MPALRFLAPAALAAFALCACATYPDDPVKPEFYVMRHLQKGESADPGLTAEGRVFSERLVLLLARRPPRAIYVSTTRRARETAAPTAGRWKLIPKEYDPSDTPGLIARVLIEKGPVLIVGHSNTVPDIVERLGAERPPPLADSDYNEVWYVSRTKRQTIKYTIGNGDNLNDAVP
jgi:phosphohistidine phosphatase SixA